MISNDSRSSTQRNNNKNMPRSFSDFLKIKRKMFWVDRYITVADSKLIYYVEKDDLKPRCVIHLQEATLKQKFDNKDELIQLKVTSQDLQVQIQILEKKKRQQFLKCIKQNMKKKTHFRKKEDSDSSDYESSQQQSLILKKKNKKFENQDILKYPQLPNAFKEIMKLEYKRISIQKNCVKYLKQQQKQQPYLFEIFLQVLKQFIDQLEVIFLMSLVLVILILIFIFPIGLLPFAILIIRKIKQKMEQFIKQNKEKLSFLKTEYLILQNKYILLQMILEKRKQFYVQNYEKKTNQIIEFDITHDLFQWENKLYIVECYHQKLFYLWEIEGIQNPDNKSIVTVHNHSNYKQINLYLLDFFLLRKRMHIKNLNLNNFTPQFNKLEQMFQQNTNTNLNVTTNQQNIIRNNSNVFPKINKNEQILVPTNQIQKPNIPTQYFQQIQKSRENINKYIYDQWEVSQTKNNCKLFIKQSGDVVIIKIEGIINGGNIQEVVQYLCQPANRKEYDQMIDKTILIKKIDTLSIFYQRFKGMFPVDGREFIFIFTKQNIENGYILHGKSIDYQYKGQPNSVRAQLISGGFQVRKIGEQKIMITYIGASDLKGNLPKFVIRQGSKLSLNMILNLKEIIQKQKYKQKIN